MLNAAKLGHSADAVSAVIKRGKTLLGVKHPIEMKLILLCVLAAPAVLGNAKTALKFKYEI